MVAKFLSLIFILFGLGMLTNAQPNRNPGQNSPDITFNDGEHMDFDRFEMPRVYMENRKVVALFLAAKPKGKEDSFSVVLPVNYK